MVLPREKALCISAAVSAGRQARHLCLHGQGLLTLRISLPQYLKCISVKSRFLLYWAYSSLLPSNLQTFFFHPQQQLYPVGRGNLGQVTLSFCVFLSPVHERVIIYLCRWDLLLHPPLTCHDSPPSHLLLQGIGEQLDLPEPRKKGPSLTFVCLLLASTTVPDVWYTILKWGFDW